MRQPSDGSHRPHGRSQAEIYPLPRLRIPLGRPEHRHRAVPVAFFREIGVSLHEEADGKLFPDTNRARDVLDALLREAARSGVALAADHRVLDVAAGADGFRLTTSRGAFDAGTVVLATGG